MKNISEEEEEVYMEMDKFPLNPMSNRPANLSKKSISDSINSNNHYSNRKFFSVHDEGSHGRMDNWAVENIDDMKTSRREYGNAKTRYPISQHSSDRRLGERGDGGVRFLDSNYPPNEGPSNNYYSGARYESSRVEYLERDRAQLLRKLEELDTQLNRSCKVVEKPQYKVALDGSMPPQDPYFATGGRFHSPSTSSTASSMKPPYNHHYPEPEPYVNRFERGVNGLYQPPIQYQKQQSHPYFSRQYTDAHLTPFEPHIPNHIPHHPSPPMPNSTFGNDPTFYDRKNVSQSSSYDTQSHKRWSSDVYSDMGGGGGGIGGGISGGIGVSQSSSYDTQSHKRWSSDVYSDMGSVGGGKNRPQRAVMANNGQRCRPVGGGSPFITCCNCFELLQFPKRVRAEKDEQKIKCGACLVVLSWAVLDKKRVVSVCVETKQTATPTSQLGNNSSQVEVKPSDDHTNQDSDSFLSDNFDSSGYDIPPLGMASNESISYRDFNSSKSEEKQEILHSSSANIPKDEDSPDGLNAQKEVVNSIDLQKKPPPPGSSLQEHFDYSTNNRRKENSPSVQEKVPKSPLSATEMQVSFTEYSHTRSVDSTDTVLEEVKPKVNQTKDVRKKNIESNDIVEDGKISVKINGRPLPNHLVKKAERLAGPIRPGQYWYDYRAGFWGVIGGPCLGIIPPYIEEFNYPMREDCAGGDTGVFVNGRELHQKDLKLLMRRGLPPGGDRYYVIDITGKVIDEDTGDELDSLGRLAPTVEKAKHGFGMKVPRAAAS